MKYKLIETGKDLKFILLLFTMILMASITFMVGLDEKESIALWSDKLLPEAEE